MAVLGAAWKVSVVQHCEMSAFSKPALPEVAQLKTSAAACVADCKQIVEWPCCLRLQLVNKNSFNPLICSGNLS